MKNVVFGLFEERDDARRVLRQLADSPLDLDTVQIVHADPDVQYQLSSEIGLPADRAMPTGLIIGALLGAALGAYSGNSWLASLGPLLAAAGGMLVGGAAGAVVGAVAETVRLPGQSADEIVAAVDGGGTAILVRTTNLPTARAISDLFYAGGARAMPAIDGGVGDEDISVFAPRPFSTAESQAWAVEQAAPAPGDQGSSDHRAGDDGEELFAPPWRRTPFAMRPSQGAVAPPITPHDDAGATALPESWDSAPTEGAPGDEDPADGGSRESGDEGLADDARASFDPADDVGAAGESATGAPDNDGPAVGASDDANDDSPTA